MINDSERRAAAARIRQFLSVPWNERPWGQDGLQTVGSLVGTSIGESIIERLADLIDRPTCENVGGAEHAFMCSECGAYTTFTHFFAPKDVQERVLSEMCDELGIDREHTRFSPMHSSVPKYCPWCGSEVVDDD